MMNDLTTYFLIALIFSIIGLFIGKILAKLNFEKEKTTLEKEKSTLEERAALLQESKDMVQNNYIELQKEVKSNQQEKEGLINNQTELQLNKKAKYFWQVISIDSEGNQSHSEIFQFQTF